MNLKSKSKVPELMAQTGRAAVNHQLSTRH
jgi:hypothetical protein